MPEEKPLTAVNGPEPGADDRMWGLAVTALHNNLWGHGNHFYKDSSVLDGSNTRSGSINQYD
jgi:hypothetical protein